MRVLWPLLGLLGIADSASAAVRCDFSEKYRCFAGGCTPANLSVFIRLDHEAGTYERCDTRGCDSYTATYNRSGEFVNVALPERGVLAKLSLGDGKFLEVATLGLDTLAGFGTCAVER
jgi:hypothetical protein